MCNGLIDVVLLSSFRKVVWRLHDQQMDFQRLQVSTNNCCCDSLADGSEVSLLAFEVIMIALERGQACS